MNIAYQRLCQMPEAWPELIELADQFQPPSTRNRSYQEIKKIDSRERSWYKSNRADGIIGFLFPNHYERNEDGYPRVKARRASVSRLELVGEQRGCRNAVLGELGQHFLPYGFTLKEIDLESCHTQILVDLGIGWHERTAGQRRQFVETHHWEFGCRISRRV
uniref:Uncharacterized protein orf161 n=1 Tax=Staurastrum punctulatum TaxID=102822 RepID=Q32RR2_STAPU|nr:hypothetical protein StpuCp101 [Staurastrum punctulatum]AAX45777.1 hypothetical protein [Staurastrum punctulatum]